MKYEQMMLEEVRRYLNDDTYDYALMIDGDWGCGKTYFIKEVLSKELNTIKKNGIDNRVRYYSTCGIDSLGEFKETMIYDLLARKADQLPEIIEEDKKEMKEELAEFDDDTGKEKPNLLHHRLEEKKDLIEEVLEEQRKERRARIQSFKNTRAFRIGLDIGGKMVTGMLKSKVPFLGAVNAGDYLAEVEDLQEYVFVFDDIERCTFSVYALLCFINEIVEHSHAKVILVMNESALLRDQQNYNAVTEYIKYLGIKEKLVGCMLHYKSDNPEIFDKLIRRNLTEESIFRTSALRHIPDFCTMMKENHHHSLRTIQFYLSRMQSMEAMLRESELFVRGAGNISETENPSGAKAADTDSCLSDQVIDRMVLEFFDICMYYKEFAAEQTKPAEPRNYHFQSLSYYARNGLMDMDRLMQEIREAE